jgi:hypothetical protein
MPVYFDTNIIRYLRNGLRDHALSQGERKYAVLSPISILELVAQIATAPDPDDVLASIHAMAAWMDVGQSELLGWADAFVAKWIFSKQVPDEASDHLARALTVCYGSGKADDKLREDAAALADFLERQKHIKAAAFQEAAKKIRQNPEDNTDGNLRGAARFAIAAALRSRGGVAPEELSEATIEARLPAYFEYHVDLVVRAIHQDDFNFFSRKHLNDHFDAEQLIFLADPSLHFFTTDGGYACAAKVEPRVHILEACEVEDPAKALGIMTNEIQRLTANEAISLDFNR